VDETTRLVLTIFAGIFGLLIGSFLNVCIFRLPRNCMSIVKPRSRCIRCLTFIAWYDNLPVLSWLFLRGKCRHCSEGISFRYPAVELLTGGIMVYAAVGQLYGEPTSVFHQTLFFSMQAYLCSALIACTFIDLEFQILPDEITLSGILIGLICGAAFPAIHGSGLPAIDWNPHLVGGVASLLGAILGAGSTYTVRVVGSILYKQEAMGLGDVKFMAFLGAFLGWKGILLTFLLGCFAGALFGVGYLVVKGRLRGVQVPFGPFLALGAVLVIFFAPEVNDLIRAYLDMFRGEA
jgi:leader peptidase (prepilin peptidase)/N-methyltransferase